MNKTGFQAAILAVTMGAVIAAPAQAQTRPAGQQPANRAAPAPAPSPAASPRPVAEEGAAIKNTEVVARVGLDYELKTVRKGALFYEEYLPPETIFYSLVMANDSRRAGQPRTAVAMLDWLQESAPDIVQVGGGETVGKGLCAIRFERGSAGGGS